MVRKILYIYWKICKCVLLIFSYIKYFSVSYEDKSSRSKKRKASIYFEKLNEKLFLVLVYSIISMTICKRNKKKKVK